MINGVLSLIWGASFYMNGYRYGILNEEKERWWYLPLNEYLFKLITCSLLIVIPIGGILSLLPIATFLDLVHIRITLPLEFILICLGVYVSARLSMVFPLVALDHKNPFRTSWQMMKGNVFRLLKMVFLMCFSIFLSILLAIFIIEIFTFILKLITPIFGGYFQVINIAIFGKIISSLMSLLFVGVGLKGVLGFFVDFISGAGLSIINSKLFYSFIIIDFIFLPPILLFTWALFTKAFSLFYLSLREGKI